MPAHDFGPGLREGLERGFDGGFHWFGLVPMLLFAVLIGVIVWAVIRLTREGGSRALAGNGGSATTSTPIRPDGALEELRLRYARGEMTREDYADRLRDLTGGPAARGPAAPGPPGPTPSDGT